MKKKSPREDANKHPLEFVAAQSEEMAAARNKICPAANAAVAADAYLGNMKGEDSDLSYLLEALQENMREVNAGNLTELENMLIGQATALQTMFVSLAMRAQNQQYQKNLESFLTLALKCQAQSRATLQAVADLKYPRQATFVKQANIANGPQQVNNRLEGASKQDTLIHKHSRAGKNKTALNRLIEVQPYGSKKMDARATPTTAGGHPTVEALAAIHRT